MARNKSQVSIDLTNEFIERAKRLAAKQYRSLSSLLGMAIYSFFGEMKELENEQNEGKNGGAK